jgi:hypothetical protein
MTPEKFAERMREIAKEDRHFDASHSAADNLMCEILAELGYEEGVDIFLDMDKWYA